MGDRRLAREIAVQTLYEIAHTEEPFGRALRSNLERRQAGDEVAAYAERLLQTITAHRDSIDAQLGAALENWSWERVALVDRCVLQVGCAEILHHEDIPLRVALDEAVEIARKFSTHESGAFVNGVLDKIASLPRPDAKS
jgi:N utilization substance protein B